MMSLKFTNCLILFVVGLLCFAAGYYSGKGHKFELLLAEVPALLEEAGCLAAPPADGAF